MRTALENYINQSSKQLPEYIYEHVDFSDAYFRDFFKLTSSDLKSKDNTMQSIESILIDLAGSPDGDFMDICFMLMDNPEDNPLSVFNYTTFHEGLKRTCYLNVYKNANHYLCCFELMNSSTGEGSLDILTTKDPLPFCMDAAHRTLIAYELEHKHALENNTVEPSPIQWNVELLN